MNQNRLIHKNIIFYRRYYQLVAMAALITVAVLTGSLMIGDSVRTTLIKRVAERLGDTETIVFSHHSFLEERILESPLLKDRARGVLLVNGFVSQSGKLIPVFVWGVDDLSIAKGTARINRSLLGELGTNQPDAIVLRLPASGLVPSGSLFVTENYTTGMRLSFDGIVDRNDGGNISLKNEQTIPLNIFVNRHELAETMQIERKINLILANKEIAATEFEQAWDYTVSGLSVDAMDGAMDGVMDGYTEITSDRIFLQDEVVASICENNQAPNRLFSYLANTIERMGDASATQQAIPYSFVTAMDRYQGEIVQPDEIILSDYAANRLSAQTGDRMKVTYYTSKDLKTLQTRSVALLIKKIVPLGELVADRTLSAEFPGLSNVESCTDWDSDLPINMDLITKEDEKYWELYRTTPKAIVAYRAVAGDWSNEYGSATAIRIENPNNGPLPSLRGVPAGAVRPSMFGVQIIYPRAAGIFAATNGVDFSGLFLALGIFIVISAVLLMIVPLSEMLFRRSNETTLLKAIGYPRKRITRLLWRESAPVVLVASVSGVLTGLLYTSLIIWLLGSLWKGATHTDGFSVYPDMITILAGSLVGVVLSLVILQRTIVRNLKDKQAAVKMKSISHPISLKISLKKRRAAALLAFVFASGMLGVNVFFLQSVALFVLSGTALLATAAIGGNYLICRNGNGCSGSLNDKKMIWSALYANKKQVMLSFLSLASGVFIVFSVGLNRKGFENSSQLRAGTGGYTLWCESTVPVYHNLSTREGREKLSLTTLPADVEALQCLRYGADDASCLNLNKVSTPTVLGIDMKQLSESDFQIMQNIYSLDGKEVFNRMQHQADSPVYPALVDASVLTWSLGMKLGDTLYYTGDRGRTVAIQLAGTLPNTIFQGNILIDKNSFKAIWEETTGSEVFLLKTGESESGAVKTLLSQAMNEYGVRVTTTNDRLKQFNSVTDTYLTIFMTLGSIGLLLGIMSFVIVVRKSLAARRKEIDLFRTLGFPDGKIERTLYKEILAAPLYAILTGTASSLAGVGVSYANTGAGTWMMALLFTIAFVGCVLLFVKKSVRKELISTDSAVFPIAGK